MSEWLKEHAWKACVGETLPWVRIPLSPPTEAFYRDESRAGTGRNEHGRVALAQEYPEMKDWGVNLTRSTTPSSVGPKRASAKAAWRARYWDANWNAPRPCVNTTVWWVAGLIVMS